MRSTIESLAARNVSDDEMKKAKDLLRAELKLSQNDPLYWIQVANIRYTESKNLNNNADTVIAGVKANQVRTIISGLDEGSRVEYTVE